MLFMIVTVFKGVKIKQLGFHALLVVPSWNRSFVCSSILGFMPFLSTLQLLYFHVITLLFTMLLVLLAFFHCSQHNTFRPCLIGIFFNNFVSTKVLFYYNTNLCIKSTLIQSVYFDIHDK